MVSGNEKDELFIAGWMPANQIKTAIFDFVFIFLGVIVVCLSTYFHIVEPGKNWLSRSGAVVVLLGAVLEYRHAYFAQKVAETSISWASGMGGPTIFGLAKHRITLKYIAHVFVVFGTLLWGYGDLFW